MKNQQVLLAARPRGPVELKHFRFVDAPVPAAADGEFVVRAHYLSLDPYMRGRMDDAADALGVGSRAAEGDLSGAIGDACREFFDVLGVPSRLRELRIPHEALPQIAGDVSNDWFFTQNPRPMQQAELMALLEAAW